jgi:putative redox protein
MDIEVKMLPDRRVEAVMGTNSILVDTKEAEGGLGEKPSPSAVFLASIATCTALYVQGFCGNRDIDTSDIKLTQSVVWSEDGKRMEKVQTKIMLPPGFPAKYKDAIKRVADLCFVKKTILDPPEMPLEVELESA